MHVVRWTDLSRTELSRYLVPSHLPTSLQCVQRPNQQLAHIHHLFPTEYFQLLFKICESCVFTRVFVPSVKYSSSSSRPKKRRCRRSSKQVFAVVNMYKNSASLYMMSFSPKCSQHLCKHYHGNSCDQTCLSSCSPPSVCSATKHRRPRSFLSLGHVVFSRTALTFIAIALLLLFPS